MGLTVREALTLPVLFHGRPRVLCGEEHLDRQVRWVHTGEIADIAGYLSGGEVLLTAGLGFGESAAQQRAYVRSLAAAGLSALIVEHAGRAFSEVPAAAVDEGRIAGLPIIGLPEEVRFVEVSATIHRIIAGSRLAELEATQDIVEQFQQLLVDGADRMAVLERLAHITGCAVVLEDAAHQIKGWVGTGETLGPVVDRWDHHSRTAHESAPAPPPESSCTVGDVIVRGEMWGRLHVFHTVGLSVSDRVAISHALAGIAITSLGEQAQRDGLALRSSSLINRFALGDINGEELVRRARSLGSRLDGHRLLAVASDANPDNCVGAALDELRVGYLGADMGSYHQWIVGLRRNTSVDDAARALQRSRRRCGISRQTNADGLRRALRQCKQALDGTSDEVGRRVRRFDDLGVARLLVGLSHDDLAGYVEDELGSLLDHDAKTGGPLLPTLRAFLEVGGTRSAAAERLHVQRRSLYYRLDRIERVLGVDLAEPEDRGRLLIALKALDLLQQGVP